MSKETGFFVRTGAPKSKQKTLSAETLRKLGPESVASMNPRAENPDMSATGVDNPLVYILGEAPGEEEDGKGEHFVGKHGRLLRLNLPRGYRESTRFNTCVGTRPPNDRLPKEIEIEAFRTKVERDIEKAKPKVILGCGSIPLEWAIGKIRNSNIFTCRGRHFPIKIREHVCWYVPTWHPSYISVRIGTVAKLDDDFLRDLRDKKYSQGKMYAPIWRRDLEDAYRLAEEGSAPRVWTEADLRKNLQLFRAADTVGATDDLMARVEKTLATGKFTIDIETKGLRPYAKSARIVSCAITDKFGTYAFCVDHPKESWGSNREYVWSALEKLVRMDGIKIAHNAPYELEWFAFFFGWDVPYIGEWRCTMSHAYVLDNRPSQKKDDADATGPGLSLNFVGVYRLGLKIKELTSVDRINPEKQEPEQLLTYNAYDTASTAPIERIQRRIIEADPKLITANQSQQERIRPLVMARLKGFPVKQQEVERTSEYLKSRVQKIETEISESKEARLYGKKFGTLNPGSPDQLAVLFRDVLERPEGRQENGKYSTKKEVLLKINTPFAHLILGYREVERLRGTYVDAMDQRNPDNKLSPDGRLHTELNSTATLSSRFASRNPPLQNIPVRSVEGKKIRRCFEPRNPDSWLIEVDLGQIEYRVIGMLTNDKVIVDSCWSDYDVHLEWAKKIAKAWPETIDRRYGKYDWDVAIGKFRSDVKTDWVFSGFYGAGVATRARRLQMDIPVAEKLDREFNEYFGGIKPWHRELERFYKKYGYVENLIGFRRYGPMTYNEMINHPVQSTAAVLIADPMDRIDARAVEIKDKAYAVNLQIHDSLLGVMPSDRVTPYAKRWVRSMLNVDFDFINVPITCEVKAGKNWEQMKKIGTYRSDRMEEIKQLVIR